MSGMDIANLLQKKMRLEKEIDNENTIHAKISKTISKTKHWIILSLFFFLALLTLFIIFDQKMDDIRMPIKNTIPLTEEVTHHVTPEECYPYNMEFTVEEYKYTLAKVAKIQGVYLMSETLMINDYGGTSEYYIVLFENINGENGAFACNSEAYAPDFVQNYIQSSYGQIQALQSPALIYGKTRQFMLPFSDNTGDSLNTKLDEKYFIDTRFKSYEKEVEIPGAREEQERLNALYNAAYKEARSKKQSFRILSIIFFFLLQFCIIDLIITFIVRINLHKALQLSTRRLKELQYSLRNLSKDLLSADNDA